MTDKKEKIENTAVAEARKNSANANAHYETLIKANRGKPFDAAKTAELKKALNAKRAAVTALANVLAGGVVTGDKCEGAKV